MKTLYMVLAGLLLLAGSGAGQAAEGVDFNAMLRDAFGDENKTCVFIGTISKEIAVHPEDGHLRSLRIAAYGSLYDPYSAKPDVDALAALHPDSPDMQLTKCLYEEATGADKSACRACYMGVATLCEKLGKADAHSHEYLLALLLAEAPEAAAAKQRFLDALSDSLMDQELHKTLTHFSRDRMIRKVERSEIRHSCPKAG